MPRLLRWAWRRKVTSITILLALGTVFLWKPELVALTLVAVAVFFAACLALALLPTLFRTSPNNTKRPTASASTSPAGTKHPPTPPSPAAGGGHGHPKKVWWVGALWSIVIGGGALLLILWVVSAAYKESARTAQLTISPPPAATPAESDVCIGVPREKPIWLDVPDFGPDKAEEWSETVQVALHCHLRVVGPLPPDVHAQCRIDDEPWHDQGTNNCDPAMLQKVEFRFHADTAKTISLYFE